MIWLDLDVEPAPDTGTPSVEAHSSAVTGMSTNSSFSIGPGYLCLQFTF